MSNKKIIIVGGSGTIGSEIAKEVKNDGFQPHLIGRNITSLKSVSQELNCPFNEVDINNTDKLKECLNNITDEVFGFAYCVGSINLKPIKSASENDFIESFKINTIGAIVSIQHLLEKENFTLIEGDIRDLATCQKACGGVNYILHEAALGSVPRSIEDPLTSNEVNVNGFLNMLVAARDQEDKA